MRSVRIRHAGACRNLLKLRPRGGQSLGRPGNRLSLRRNAWVELKCTMLHLQIVRLPQFVDPSLADIAPRSNEIADDEQLQRHPPSVAAVARRLHTEKVAANL